MSPMRGDDLGTMVPLGGSSGAKELLRLPKQVEQDSPASGIFIRGRIREDLAGLYGLAATLGGNHKPTLSFLAYMSSARLGVNGLARNEYSMAHTGMLVPSAMPTATRFVSRDGDNGKRTGYGKRPTNGKNEDDE